MTRHIDRIMADAAAHGLVSEKFLASEASDRPWPVVAMTGFMTLLAALAMFGVLYGMFFANGNVDSFIPGAIVTVCAVALLRKRRLALFAEYLGASLLGSGIAMVIAKDGGEGTIAAGGTLTLLVTTLVPQRWLRIVLAAAGASLLIHAFGSSNHGLVGFGAAEWSGCQAALLAWLSAHAALRRLEQSGRYAQAAWLESVLIGAGTAIILWLAYISGSTFLAGGLPQDMVLGDINRNGAKTVHSAISSLSALAAVAWLCTCKDMQNRRWLVAVTPVIIALSWFATSLGALSLAIAACLIWRRPQLAILAAVAALWTIGAMYYALDWPLLYKSAVLLVCGLCLLASTRLIRAETLVSVSDAPVEADRPWTQWALIAPALLTLALTNAGMWNNEQVLSHGTTVFVELAPVDPRSLMQGDYMALRFALPREDKGMSPPPEFVVAQRGEDGVAILTRFHDGESALASGELLIRMSRREGRGVLVTNAFFFREGDGERWAGAKYGEFRIGRDGQAILVGLRGQGLSAL